MSTPPALGASALLPSNQLAVARPFGERPGFERTGGDAKTSP